MDSRLKGFSDRLYRCLMSAYPAEFQQRFSAEMAQVYRSLCCQVYQDAGISGLLHIWLSEIWDLPMAALVQWGQILTKRRMVSMQANPWDKTDGTIPLNPRQAFLAVLPFLLFGIASLVGRLDFFYTHPANLPLWQVLLTDPDLVCGWTILIGLAAGIIAGFPRWTFSYLSWGLLYAWNWSNGVFYGHVIRGESWLIFLAVVAVSLLIRRSIQPLRVILASLWCDLTLLPFGIFTLYTWLYMLADSNHNPYLTLFIIATTLVTCLGAWGFFRSTSPVRRVLALIGGLFLAMVIDAVNNATWDFAAYYGLPKGQEGINPRLALAILSLFLVMLGLGWITRWRQQRWKA